MIVCHQRYRYDAYDLINIQHLSLLKSSKGGKGKNSSKEPSRKGKGGKGKKSSKEPSSNGKGGKGKNSSKEPSSKGKGGKSKKSGKEPKSKKKSKKGNKSTKSPSGGNGRVTLTPTTSATNSCGMSNAERANAIKDIVVTLSTAKQLETSGTPQNRAFNWLTKQDSLFVCPDDRQSVRQRYTLAVVYFAVDGDSWDKCSRKNRTCTTMVGGKLRSFASYLSSDDVCKWFGVSCDGAGDITHVLLG